MRRGPSYYDKNLPMEYRAELFANSEWGQCGCELLQNAGGTLSGEAVREFISDSFCDVADLQKWWWNLEASRRDELLRKWFPHSTYWI